MVYLDLLKVLGQSSKFMYFPVSAFLFKVRLDLWDYIYIYTHATPIGLMLQKSRNHYKKYV